MAPWNELKMRRSMVCADERAREEAATSVEEDGAYRENSEAEPGVPSIAPTPLLGSGTCHRSAGLVIESDPSLERTAQHSQGEIQTRNEIEEDPSGKSALLTKEPANIAAIVSEDEHEYDGESSLSSQDNLKLMKSGEVSDQFEPLGCSVPVCDNLSKYVPYHVQFEQCALAEFEDELFGSTNQRCINVDVVRANIDSTTETGTRRTDSFSIFNGFGNCGSSALSTHHPQQHKSWWSTSSSTPHVARAFSSHPPLQVDQKQTRAESRTHHPTDCQKFYAAPPLNQLLAERKWQEASLRLLRFPKEALLDPVPAEMQDDVCVQQNGDAEMEKSFPQFLAHHRRRYGMSAGSRSSSPFSHDDEEEDDEDACMMLPRQRVTSSSSSSSFPSTRDTLLHVAINLHAPLSFLKDLVDASPNLARCRNPLDGRTPVHVAVLKLVHCVPFLGNAYASTGASASASASACASAQESCQTDGDFMYSPKWNSTDGSNAWVKQSALKGSQDCFVSGIACTSDGSYGSKEFSCPNRKNSLDSASSFGHEDHKNNSIISQQPDICELVEIVRYMLSKCPSAGRVKDKMGYTPLRLWTNISYSLPVTLLSVSCRQGREEMKKLHYKMHVDMLKALLSATIVERGEARKSHGRRRLVQAEDEGLQQQNDGTFSDSFSHDNGRFAGVDRSKDHTQYNEDEYEEGDASDDDDDDAMTLHRLCSIGNTLSTCFNGCATSSFVDESSASGGQEAKLLPPLLTTEVVELLLDAHPISASMRNFRFDTPLHCLLYVNHNAFESGCCCCYCNGDESGECVVEDIGYVCEKFKDREKDGWRLRSCQDSSSSEDDCGRSCSGDSPSRTIGNVVKTLVDDFPIATTMQNHAQKTPLHLACENDAHPDTISVLLSAGSNSDAVGKICEGRKALRMTDHQGRLPLHLACKNRVSSDTIALLLKEYPQAASVRDNQGETPLSYLTTMVTSSTASSSSSNSCSDRSADVAIIRLVARATEAHIFKEPCRGMESGGTFLHRAVFQGAPRSIVEVIHEAHPDAPSVLDRNGNTPLHVACKEKKASMEVTRYLLKVCPSSAFVQNTVDGNTPLHLACKRGLPVSIAKALIRAAPSSLTAKNWRGNTALHFACAHGASMLSVIKTMVAALPCGPSIPNGSGKTPLYLASASSGASPRLISVLLAANPVAASVTDDEGTTPLLAAIQRMAPPSVVRSLYMGYPEAVSKRNSRGNSPVTALVQTALFYADRNPNSSRSDGQQRPPPNGNATVNETTKAMLLHMTKYYPEAVSLTDADGYSAVHYAFLQFKSAATRRINLRRDSAALTMIQQVDEDRRAILRSPERLRLCKGPAWEQLSILLKASYDCNENEHDSAVDDSCPHFLDNENVNSNEEKGLQTQPPSWLMFHAICNSDCPSEAVTFALSARREEVHMKCQRRGWLPLHVLANKKATGSECASPLNERFVLTEPANVIASNNWSARYDFSSVGQNSVSQRTSVNRASSPQLEHEEHKRRRGALILSSIKSVLEVYPDAARVPDDKGRLPLNLCIESGKGWNAGLKLIMEAAPEALQARDTKTHLYPFMIAASRPSSSLSTLEDVFHLLLSNPEVVRIGVR